MSVTRPILRYHGGKWKLAPWIIANMPAHRVYVEPFGGGGSVLLRKARAAAEIYNDRWDELVNIFTCLRDPVLAAELRSAVRLTPFARTEFARVEDDPEAVPVERARRTLFRAAASHSPGSFAAGKSTGFRDYNGHANRRTPPAWDWAAWPESIDSVTERLAGVIIENRDALDVILRHDSPATLHYIDPPYVHAARSMERSNAKYRFELDDEAHRRLIAVLRGLRGMVMISGYPCDLYSELLSDWQQLECSTHADGARDRTECLWFNGAAWSARPQRGLMDASEVDAA